MNSKMKSSSALSNLGHKYNFCMLWENLCFCHFGSFFGVSCHICYFLAGFFLPFWFIFSVPHIKSRNRLCFLPLWLLFGCFEYNLISYFSSPSRAAVPKARNRISAPSDRDDQVTRTHQTKVVDRLGPKGLYQV